MTVTLFKNLDIHRYAKNSNEKSPKIQNSNEKYPKIRMDHTALFSGLREAIFNRNDRRGLVIGSVADFQRHEDKFGEVLSKSEVCCDILC